MLRLTDARPIGLSIDLVRSSVKAAAGDARTELIGGYISRDAGQSIGTELQQQSTSLAAIGASIENAGFSGAREHIAMGVRHIDGLRKTVDQITAHPSELHNSNAIEVATDDAVHALDGVAALVRDNTESAARSKLSDARERVFSRDGLRKGLAGAALIVGATLTYDAATTSPTERVEQRAEAAAETRQRAVTAAAEARAEREARSMDHYVDDGDAMIGVQIGEVSVESQIRDDSDLVILDATADTFTKDGARDEVRSLQSADAAAGRVAHAYMLHDFDGDGKYTAYQLDDTLVARADDYRQVKPGQSTELRGSNNVVDAHAYDKDTFGLDGEVFIDGVGNVLPG